MSQQLQITGGAKVRDLQDVIIGTSGVLSSLAFNVANGVPKLDSNGKILVSQLPNSVMEYQGTWNASTNTPTLVNGVGNQGDVYLCNVAGTTNFGAGPITFAVGDSAIYSGTIWQRAGGATGTVTSVGLSTSGNAFTIGSSPVTTSGTITINGSGTSGQYINGAGNLTTFPTLLSSVGLSMPSAFSVSNSPLTANGTIAVTGAGYPSQYIRGDGTLADFPTSGGGGSSVSYYLNGGTSQGTIAGVTYYEMSKTADTGTGVDFPKSGDGLIVSFLTDAGDPAQLNIPAGNWNYEIYASMSSNGGTPQMYAELYVYNGTTFTLISTSSNEILYDGVNLNLYTFAMTVPATTLALTDRLAVKLYATNSGGKTTTVHTQDSHLCQIITTFSTGITALNGLTAQVQYFATGTSGTDFNISSTTATHTFNIPDASASARGLITTGTQTIAGIKTFNLSTKNETGIQLKNDIGIVPVVTGYTNLNGLSNGLAITNSAGVSNNLLVPSTTGYSYTFPNATGTLALLENAQTFSGAKTFSGFASFTSTSGTNTQYGIYLSKGSTPTAFSTTTVNIYSDVTTNNLVIRDNSSTANLVFNNSTQTYTFPAASGTIALTSSLASYVPYTGATANVDLGLFSLKSNGVLAYGNGTAGGIVSFTQTGTLAGVATGAASIGSVSAGKLNIYFGDSGLECVELDNSLLTASRTYNFPNASGTLALTSQIPSNIVTGTGASGRLAYWNGTSTQTSDGNLTWDSTYSALSSITFYALNSTKAAFNLSSNTDNVGKIQNVTATSWSLAYGTADLSFPKGTSVLTWDTTNKVTFAGTLSNGTYTYTLPSATGTLALTSDLGSYLPLTGGTLTGGLYINPTNTATVGLDVASDTIRFRSDNLEGFKRQLEITMGSGTLVQMVAKGYGANYITDMAFYTATASGVNGSPAMYITSSNRIGILTGTPAYTLDVSGTGRFTSTLLVSGAATFSSTISATVGTFTSNNGLVLNSADAAYATFQKSGTTYGFIGTAGSGTDIITGAASGDMVLRSSQKILFSTNNGASANLTITSAGNVGIGTSTPAYQFDVYAASGYTARFNGATYGGLILANGGTANSYFVGESTLLSIEHTTAINFRTNNADRMRITSGGGVVIGATSDGGMKLRVISPSLAQGNVLFATDNNIYNSIQVYSAGADGYNAAATVMIMGRNTTNSRSINAGGSINASGADYAEYMTKAIEDNIAKGDVVGVNQNGLLTNIFTDAKSFVVKSTDPSYVGGDTWGNIDDIGKLPLDATNEQKAEHEAKIESARAKVDRIAFSGQVPCNVYDANVGDYIIPINDNGTIKGQAVTNPSFEQYQLSVGKVWKIMEDGRAWIAVKIG